MEPYQILHGDCRETLKSLPDNLVDAIVTDPPYELGFMGKGWDKSGVANDASMWAEVLRVLKPGGHILAFSGSRTYHRMASAIEDAGFEVRDQIMWVYGSGFPKSHNISKALDKDNGVDREDKFEGAFDRFADPTGNKKCDKCGKWLVSGSPCQCPRPQDEPKSAEAKQWDGWGTALKPAHEPIVLARKPLEGTVVDNVRKWGVGGLNIDGCRVATDPSVDDPRLGGNGTWSSEKMAKNAYGQYAGTEVGSSPKGRFPANLIHDGSQQVLDLFPSEAGAAAPVRSGHSGDSKHGIYGDYAQRGDDGATFRGDKGSAARFFYCAKASKKDRDEGCEHLPTQEKPAHMRTANGEGEASMTEGFQPTQRKNTHPTVKPTELMRYLVRLITPNGGTVLDPFTGSGSTGKAAMLEGCRFIGCELSEEYIVIAKARMEASYAKGNQ